MCDPFGVNVFMVVRSGEWAGMREYCSIPSHNKKDVATGSNKPLHMSLTLLLTG